MGIILPTSVAPEGIFSGGSEVHQGRACKGVAAWGGDVGSVVRSPPDAGEVFKKIVKTQRKITFLNFQEYFPIFSKILENFIELLAKMWT